MTTQMSLFDFQPQEERPQPAPEPAPTDAPKVRRIWP